MTLRELLDDTPVTITGHEPANIAGVTKDSREVGPGYIFFATGASKTFLAGALEKGAAVIVSDEPLQRDNVPCLVVTRDVRILLARMAARFNGFPSRHLVVTGITGTNGKTTISYLIESIVGAAGNRAGVIGTISYRYGAHTFKRPNTTPESAELQSLMRAMKDHGMGHAVMEVSSHALDQGRVEAIDFDHAIYTNLTHDHLDYHGDFEHYKQAKQLLFHHYLLRSVKERKYAIVNLDDPAGKSFIPARPVTTLTYSLTGDTDGRLLSSKEDIDGLSLELSLMGRKMQVRTPLVGMFNVSNILAAALFGYAAALPFESIRKGLESVEGVPGRLERVAGGHGVRVFVDYAHTPDALTKTIETLNRVRSGRLIVVFGCGGDRDRTKRPVMGRIVSQLADFAVITSDNPRTEEPHAIIDAIKEGFNGTAFKAIENRKAAIGEALSMAKENDVVLVAGKGHEDYQIIGDKVYPFSDRQVVEEYVHVVR